MKQVAGVHTDLIQTENGGRRRFVWIAALLDEESTELVLESTACQAIDEIQRPQKPHVPLSLSVSLSVELVSTLIFMYPAFE